MAIGQCSGGINVVTVALAYCTHNVVPDKKDSGLVSMSSK